MAKKITALNIGAANIELAEYELGAKGALTLAKYGIAPLAAPLDGGNAETILAPALLELVREKGFRPGKVAVSVSGQTVFPKFAAIPAAGGAERFEQMVRYEIEQGIPFPIDEMVCDRQILGDTENGDKSVMIVAAKVDQIESITNAVQSAGFSPVLVDVAPIALVNCVRLNRAGDESCVVILDIGAKITSLAIVEGDKVYTRSIPVAGNAVTKEISAALGCTAEEAEVVKREKGYVSLGGVTEDEDEVADRVSKACRAVMSRLHAEISRSINFYRSQQHGGAPSRLYLAGGTALLPQTDQFFAETLGIEVEYLNPFECIAVAPSVDAEALEYDAALLSATAGVAMHVAGSARFAINLLPPSIIAARAEKAKIPVLAAGGVALVAALVLAMLGINSETDVISGQRAAVQSKVDSLSSFDKKVSDASKRLAAAETEAGALRDLLLSRTKAVQRLNTVRDSLAPGIMWIERWEQGKITIRGWKDSIKAAAGKAAAGKTAGEIVVDKLAGRPVIEPGSVKISDMSTVGAKGQVEQFTVEVKFK